MTPADAREALRRAPHGRKRATRAKVQDALHAALAAHLASRPDPLDESARRAVEGR